MLNKMIVNMKKSFLLMFAAVALAFVGCSQNRHGSKTADGTGLSTTVTRANGGENGNDTADDKSAEGKVNYLTTAEFKKKVMDYEKHQQEWMFEGSRPAIIDFYATWCRPCKMTAPIVEELAKDYSGKIDFYKVDVDKEQDVAAAFGIQSIPTFLFIPVNGRPVVQMGAMQKTDFEEIIKSVIAK